MHQKLKLILGCIFLEHYLSSYGLPGIFLGFVLGNIGIPLPSPVLFGLLGTAVNSGSISTANAVAIVFSASLIGDLAAYGLFYTGGRPLLELFFQRLRFKRENFDRAESWYNRYGVSVLLIIRWINWGKAQMVWLCGLSRMPLKRFISASILAELPWALAWTFLAINLLGRAGSDTVSWVVIVGVMAVLQTALAVGGLYFYETHRKNGLSGQKEQKNDTKKNGNYSGIPS